MPAYLQFSQLDKQYGSVAALASLDLELEQGTVLGLLGPNGAGKSTVFGCLLGLVHPSAGQIRLRGTPITAAARARIGYAPERVALYPQQSVWENGCFFAGLRGHGAPELARQLQRVGLFDLQKRKVRQLSKGMLQRLALAIALCGKPDLLILDEPFNGLDPAWLDTLREVLMQEQHRGATLLISTHTISAIEGLASHVAILVRGRLAAFEPVEALQAKWGDTSLEQAYTRIVRTRSSRAAEVLA
jgi:ABC-type multidrug transport system ATPase subunit